MKNKLFIVVVLGLLTGAVLTLSMRFREKENYEDEFFE